MHKLRFPAVSILLIYPLLILTRRRERDSCSSDYTGVRESYLFVADCITAAAKIRALCGHVRPGKKVNLHSVNYVDACLLKIIRMMGDWHLWQYK